MAWFSNHVLHVAVQSDSRIQQNSYGGPGSISKPISAEIIHSYTSFFHGGCFGQVRDFASKCEKPPGAVLIVPLIPMLVDDPATAIVATRHLASKLSSLGTGSRGVCVTGSPCLR